MANKLVNLKVHEISLVDKAANKRKFLLMKSAEPLATTDDDEVEESTSKDFNELLQERQQREAFWELDWTLDECVTSIMQDDSLTIDQKKLKISNALDQYKNALLGSDIIKAEDSSEKYQTRGGVKYPSSCFLYVPDKNKPSTWKLLYRTPDGKISPTFVSAACAAFSETGFRGNKVQLPTDAVTDVKSKLRAAWKEAFPDKSEDEMPESIKKGEETVDDSMLNKIIDAIKKAFRKSEPEGQDDDENFDGADIINKQEGENVKVKPEELQKMIDEALAKKDEAHKAEIEGMKKQLETINAERETDIKKAEAETATAKASAEQAEIEKKAEIEKSAKAEELKKTEELKSVSIEKAEYAEKMYVLKLLSPELYEYVQNVVKAADNALATANIFQEIGKNSGSELDPKAQLEKKAEEIMKRDNCTKEASIVKAYDENPDLAKLVVIKNQ